MSLTLEERKEMIGQVAAERGVLLTPDDPIFLMIELAEVVLERNAQKVMDDAIGGLVKTGDRLEERLRAAQKVFLESTVTAVSEELDKLAGAHERRIDDQAVKIRQSLDRVAERTAQLANAQRDLQENASRPSKLTPFGWIVLGMLFGGALTGVAIWLFRI